MNSRVKNISIEAFDYALPEERIARFPLPKREDAKLLHFFDGNIETHTYRELPTLIHAQDHLVFNQTKVVQARLFFPLRENVTIEVFCLEPWENSSIDTAMSTKGAITYKCMIGGAKKWKSGQLNLSHQSQTLYAEKGENENGVFKVHFTWSEDLTFAEILEQMGKTPLPPYLKRASEESDKQRYQTVFAKQEGSVAAPTAGLHFTEALLTQLKMNGVQQSKLTLHVGAGTFKPVSASAIGEHEMHAEEFFVEKQFVEEMLDACERKNLICVGTTSMRALESMYWLGCMIESKAISKHEDFLVSQWVAYDESVETLDAKQALQALLDYLNANDLDFLQAKTQIIIAPGYQFKLTNGLFTNFHQPRSTLLLLVAAIAGEAWKRIYQYALENDFRFLSYGDGSLLRINQHNK